MMPAGLLNQLSLEEIADLFAFLTSPPSTDRLTRLRQDASNRK
jgi:hypothetical protein